MEGIYNIVPTPFDEAGAVDEPSLRRLIDFIIDTDVDGLTILGFLGEAAKLTESERAQVIDVTIEVADGRVPVVVGATAPALDPCLRDARDAADRGAAGLLVAPPRTNRPSEASVRQHYEALSEAVGIPIVVQDFPASSGVFMTPAFIGALAEDLPSCRYLKLEDDPTSQKVTAILQSQPRSGRLRGTGRQLHVRGAAARRGRHDDRASGSRRSWSRSTVTSGPAAMNERARPSTATCRSSGSRTSPG